MRARQVDKFDDFVIGLEQADVFLDRDARVVANTLLEPGQTIEERALAGIGIADNRYARVDALRYGYLTGGNADFSGTSHQPLQAQLEMAGMLLAQGDAATEEAKLHRVATDRRARVLNLGAFDEAQNHKPLYLGVGAIDCPDDALLAAFQVASVLPLITITSYKYWIFPALLDMVEMIMIRITNRNRQFYG